MLRYLHLLNDNGHRQRRLSDAMYPHQSLRSLLANPAKIRSGASPLGARSARHRSKISLVAHVSHIFAIPTDLSEIFSLANDHSQLRGTAERH